MRVRKRRDPADPPPKLRLSTSPVIKCKCHLRWRNYKVSRKKVDRQTPFVIRLVWDENVERGGPSACPWCVPSLIFRQCVAYQSPVYILINFCPFIFIAISPINTRFLPCSLTPTAASSSYLNSHTISDTLPPTSLHPSRPTTHSSQTHTHTPSHD